MAQEFKEMIERIPAEMRWIIAIRALTGANVANTKALLDIAGQERFNEIEKEIYADMGKAGKQVADALGLAGGNAKSAGEALLILSLVGMGPEFRFETVEARAEKAVMRTSACPWWNRQRELGISDDLCSAMDAAYNNAFVKSLNPKVTVSRTKATPRGDSYCEWVFEL